MMKRNTSNRKGRYQWLLALSLLLTPSVLYAWGSEGHQIVAMIAEPRLQADVRDAVTTLLGGASFVETSTWADEVRTQQTASWHYVNIPISDTAYDGEQVCPKQQCVVAQIERFRAVLADRSSHFDKRQKALKYLIHFIGDLHQPLHAGDNRDRGGNDVLVEFLGQRINPSNNKPWNLHAVWDSGMVHARDRDAQHYAERLISWLQSQPEEGFQAGSVVDWAMESQAVAKAHVYAFAENRQLGDAYVRANESVLDRQLAKAGVRLSTILNEALHHSVGAP